MNNITWTCHICNRKRPDDKISVYSSTIKVGGVEATQNVRFCNDNPECINKAPSFSFLKSRKK